jgi:uncharacterized protein YPO0396
MAKTSSATRVPRGTKILAKAFFAAADEIPEPQRAEVVKAALALIRDELKAAREKVTVAKAKAKEKAGKTLASPAYKATSVAKAPAKIQKKAASVQAKGPVKRANKAAPKSAEKTTLDKSTKRPSGPTPDSI